MRIAILTANAAVVGGAEAYLRSIVPVLISSGHEVGLGFERGPIAGYDCIGAGLPVSETWSLDDGARATHQLEGFEPDIVYQHCLVDPALEARITERFPSVLFAHDYHGTCVTGRRAHAFAPLSMCGRTLGLACLGVNYLRGCGATDPRRLLQLYRRSRDRHQTLHRFRAIVVASNHVRAVYIAHGCEPERISVMAPPPSGVVPDPEASMGHERSDRVLFLGRLTRVKGVLIAVDAVACASKLLGRKLTLVLAGTGSDFEACLARAKARRVNVDVRGWVEGSEREALLRSSDLLLVPSLWPEPFGMVGVEAGCFGLPAAAFAVGGIVDWLMPGVSGEYTEELTEAALGRAIARALGDDAHYQRLRQGALAMASARTMGKHMADLNLLLAEVASTDSHRPLVALKHV